MSKKAFKLVLRVWEVDEKDMTVQRADLLLDQIVEVIEAAGLETVAYFNELDENGEQPQDKE